MISLLVCFACAAPTTVAPTCAASPAPLVRALESFEELVAEYEAAVETWKAELSGTEDRAERKRLRNARPAKVFAPRFEALAALGEGRALVWQLDNIRHLDIAVNARDAKRLEWYGVLFEKHAGEAWFSDALTQLWSDRKRVDAPQLSAWLAAARDKNESKEVQAHARYYLAYEDVHSDDEAARRLGFAALESLIADLPDTKWTDQARQDLFLLRDRAVGMPAIDFEGKTVDGDTFKLSDYQGKVVLLDFWGFW
ncbi:MAG: redoxin domain-containing protein [Planctomycetes bacterium]|nr:redoxin domain-containing protein [Planctomycetota bacterium]MCB9905884.1 redoxin domain-containing protein [Planctomycetota bacterium]